MFFPTQEFVFVCQLRELTEDCRQNAYCLATLVEAYVLQNGQVVPDQIELSEQRYDVASMRTVLAQRFQSSVALVLSYMR